MLKWLLHKLTRRMSEEYSYDNTYLHEIIDISSTAGIRFLGLPLLSQMKAPNAALWAGAALGSTLDGDCGPCAQLVLDEAVRQGVSARDLEACLTGNLTAAGDVGLGFAFAEAAINDSETLAELREEIISRSGRHALVSVAYATAASRAYPVLKRAMGHGSVCQRLTLGDHQLEVKGKLGQSDAINAHAALD